MSRILAYELYGSPRGGLNPRGFTGPDQPTIIPERVQSRPIPNGQFRYHKNHYVQSLLNEALKLDSVGDATRAEAPPISGEHS